LWGQERDAKRRRQSEPDEIVHKEYDRPESTAAASNTQAWGAWIDARIEAAVAREREFTMDVLSQSLAGFMDDERGSITKEVELKTAELKLDLITKLESAIATMRRMLVGLAALAEERQRLVEGQLDRPATLRGSVACAAFRVGRSIPANRKRRTSAHPSRVLKLSVPKITGGGGPIFRRDATIVAARANLNWRVYRPQLIFLA
jgi:hypothetical protein